jgi:Ran GTPase-activating protein (RanGAP) involved in mRNA processing and transport
MDETELDFSSQSLRAGDAVLLASDIQDMGSLSKLDLSENDLGSEGLSAVSEALKSTSIKQLNIAENNLTYNTQDKKDMSGVIKFTRDMKDMGSLSKLDISSNSIYGEAMSVLTQALNGGTMLKELNIAGNKLDAEDAKVLAPAIQAMGSLSKLDISRNQICGLNARNGKIYGTYDASGLAALAKSIGNLKELSISNNALKAEGAKILVPALEANGSLASLDISDNHIDNEQEAKIKQICAGKSIKFTL